MKPSRFSTLISIPAVVFAILTSAVHAQSYGDHEQVLTIGAAEFRSVDLFDPLIAIDPYIDSDGYLYSSAGGAYLYRAPLSLPEGAVVNRVCLYANDSDPSDFGFVDAFLIAVKLVPAGESGAVNGIVQGTYSSSSIGYGYYCSEPSMHTLRGRFDIDEDGALDAVAYYIWADVPDAMQNSLGLGAVQVTWWRQLSPQPETPTFGDVPASDRAFGYIEALVASGITAGCGGNNYCPDANLTRRQMAVFLAKALGLHWAD